MKTIHVIIYTLCVSTTLGILTPDHNEVTTLPGMEGSGSGIDPNDTGNGGEITMKMTTVTTIESSTTSVNQTKDPTEAESSGDDETTMASTTQETTTDIDECAVNSHNCDANAECNNTLGSFTCSCRFGYTGSGLSCIDVNECFDGSDDCDDALGECTNLNGTFKCSCINGYDGDGKTCEDVNECKNGTDNCHTNANCNNTIGNFTCVCNTGYTGDGISCAEDPTTSETTASETSTGPKTSTTTVPEMTTPGPKTSTPTVLEMTTPGPKTSTKTAPDMTTPACPFLSFTSQVGANVIRLSISYPTTAQTSFNVSISGTNFQQFLSDENVVVVENLLAQERYSVVVQSNDVCGITSSKDVFTAGQCTTQCTNGNCVLDSNKEVCECILHHKSISPILCQPIPICERTDCGANAQCFNPDGCVCDGGFEKNGGNCILIDKCQPNSCQNGGSCLSSGISFSCTCPFYYFGQFCEIYQSPCTSNPCMNGGQCEDDEPGFQCKCTAQYTGNTCEENFNECEGVNTPCDQTQICNDTIGGFECVCSDGFLDNGEGGCVEIILFPYGSGEGDILLPIDDDEVSQPMQLRYGIPFGSKAFFNIRVASNGFIYLGSSFYYASSLFQPFIQGFRNSENAILAPFWDDFHPSTENNGEVYYQGYDKIGSTSLSSKALVLFKNISQRIEDKFGVSNFDPLFVYKATWSNVVMYPESSTGFRNHPSTFQCILATDGCNTYLIYLYQPTAMRWETSFRDVNNALIGYSNGAEINFDEVQGNYRPDQRLQTDGGMEQGIYLYKLTPSKTSQQNSSCSCLQWYQNDLKLPPLRAQNTCPCTIFQAWFDRRFELSIDFWFYLLNRYYNTPLWQSRVKRGSTTEWSYDAVPFGQCFQPRSGRGPRCCYVLSTSDTTTSTSSAFGTLRAGSIAEGFSASRVERNQIPYDFASVFYRDQATFDLLYQEALDNDLVPRRQCCVESIASGYCGLYMERRPKETCSNYRLPRLPRWFFGDPHFTTNDGTSYTFNGIGEFYLVYAPEIFILQTRLKQAQKADGSFSNATIFSAFAIQDNTSSSGIVEFEIDSTGSGSDILVRVSGKLQNGTIHQFSSVIEGVELSVVNGTYTAVFPSGSTMKVSASNFLLSFVFDGDEDTLLNKSRGMIGQWNGITGDDFQLRNGTTIDFENIKTTGHLEILNGTLSDKNLYEFGLSWQVQENESLFSYGGENDTFATNNPLNPPDPPFLEDLVTKNKNTSDFENKVGNCTINGVLSSTCLYDFLVTNRQDIATDTLKIEEEEEVIENINSNLCPSFTLPSDASIVGGFLLVSIGNETTITLNATDLDGDDITYTLVEKPDGVTINNGVLTWTPSELNRASNASLHVEASDGNGGTVLLNIPVKLCVCNNSGVCLYDETIGGTETYIIVGCNCTEAYDGDDCSNDRNDCLRSGCYPNVTCTDNVAPETSFECGSCPAGTEGNGRNCTAVNLCESNPCGQVCIPFFGGFNCSCRDGFEVDGTNPHLCVNINECNFGSPCKNISNSDCVDEDGGFNCNCTSGYTKRGSVCINVDECETGRDTCDNFTTTCLDMLGTFECQCKDGFSRSFNASKQDPCIDDDECELGTNNCLAPSQRCVNQVPSYICKCVTGFQGFNGSCTNINECMNISLNDCHPDSALCTDNDGSYTCACISGYSGNGTVCEDVNECLTEPCAANATCTDFDGGYNCTCDVGFEETETQTCIDIDECARNTSNCDVNANCTNTDGSFTCDCNTGFFGNGTTCLNINECETDLPCAPEGSVCMDNDGSYLCKCTFEYIGDGFTCTAKPVLTTPPQVLSVSDLCINVLIDPSASFYNYSVLLETDTASLQVSTTRAVYLVCELLPNTDYRITTAIAQETNISSFIDDPVFTSPINVKTDLKRISFAVTLIGETFLPQYNDINSKESIDLITRNKDLVVDEFNDGTFSFFLVQAIFTGFRNGSTVGNIDGSTNSTSSTVDDTDVSGAFSGSTNFSNPTTIDRPVPPIIQNLTQGNNKPVVVEYSFMDGRTVIRNEIKVLCESEFNTTFSNASPSTEMAVLSGLPQNSICDVQVRILVADDDGTTVFSDFSDPMTITTRHEFNEFLISVTGTTIQISFGNFNRLVSYNILLANITTGAEIKNVFVDDIPSEDIITFTVDGLNTNTAYKITITTATRDYVKTVREDDHTKNVTTSGIDVVSEVTVIEVLSTSFKVAYSGVAGAIEYTIRTYLDDELFNTTTSLTTSVVVSGVQPAMNDYLVSVAYNTPAQSAFSQNVTTKRWKFSNIEETGFKLTWTPLEPNLIHKYTVEIPDGDDIVENTVGEANITGLMSGTEYLVMVEAQKIVSAMIEETLLFRILQFTLPSAPLLQAISTSAENTAYVEWDAVTGADYYEISVTADDTENVLSDIVGAGNTTDTNRTFTNLANGTSYTVEICSRNNNVEKKSCNLTRITGMLVQPEAPTITSVSPTSVNFSFIEVPGALSYNISVSLENGSLFMVLETVATPLMVMGLTSGTVYQFSVVAIYELGTATSNSKRQITAPATPTNLEATDVTTEYIILTWNSVLTAKLYRVMYDGNSDTFTEATANVTGLAAGTIYTFEVVALNEDLESFTSSPLKQITVPSKPTFTMNPVTQTTIMVVWSMPNTTNDFDFVVELRRGMDTVSIDEITDPFIEYTSMNDIQVGTNYTLCVQSRTSNMTMVVGQQQTSSKSCIDVTTRPGNTTSPVELSSTANSLQFNWTSAEGASYYEASATLLSNTSQSTKQIVSVGTTTNITGLMSGEKYMISVTPFNHLGVMSFKFGDVTMETNPVNPTVGIQDVTTNSLTVTWSITNPIILTLVDVRRANGFPTESGITIDEDGQFFPREGNVAGIRGLSPGIRYNVIVISFSLGKKSEKTIFKFITAPSNPVNVRLMERNSSSVRIGWDNVTGADAYITTLTGSRFLQSLETDSPEATFTLLAPSTSYNAVVIAQNEAGNSTQSLSFAALTTPNIPSNVQAVPSNRSIVISFSSALGAVRYTIVGTSTSGDEIKVENLNDTSHEITEFVLGVAYDFSVVSIDSEGIMSTPAHKRSVTAPLKQFIFQTTLISNFIYLTAYENTSSTEYTRLAKQLLPDLEEALTGARGFSSVNITHAFEGSVVIEMIVFSNDPGATPMVYETEFADKRNSLVFATGLSSDLNACLRKPCEANYTCIVTSTSYTCNCMGGFAMNGSSCEDFDECANSSTNSCLEFANCYNIIGSYECRCKTGFTGNGTNCNDIEECLHNPCQPNGTCNETPGSFTCICDPGFYGDGDLCNDINECNSTSSSCPRNHNCMNTVGSYLCTCKKGYILNGADCMNINECDMSTPCSEHADCNDTDGSFSCSCKLGYSGNGTVCMNVNECVEDNLCSENANCTDNEGSYDCLCDVGYKGNGIFCEDINECTASSPCNVNATCSNTIGSFNCRCNKGFSGDGIACNNINECEDLGACHAKAQCKDTIGNFTCTCNEGYIEEGEICRDIDECSSNPCHRNANCSNVDGSFQCVCGFGFNGNGLFCQNIDECAAPSVPCGNNAKCIDTVGSFVCTCDPGYNGDGITCVVDPLCTPSTCDSNAVCTVVVGSATCSCNPGFSGDGTACENIDECDLNTHDCDRNAVCTDTMGSFTCQCNPDFIGTGQSCDLDECLTDPCHIDATCTNTIGTFICICNTGFFGNGFNCEVCATPSPCPSNALCILKDSSPLCQCDAGFTGNETFCEDIDDCSSPVCDQNADCLNTIGSFLCQCKQGFFGSGSSCSDVNECDTGEDNCHPLANCSNTIGSFSCACFDGYDGNGTACEDVDECLIGTDNCLSNAVCRNNIGSYMCTCQPGFEGDGVNQCSGITFLIQLTLNATFEYNTDLNDTSSQAYNDLSMFTKNQLQIKFQHAVSFKKLTFYQGSIIVVILIEIQESATIEQILAAYDDTAGEPAFTGPPTEDINSCFTATCAINEVCKNIPKETSTCECKQGYFNTTGTCLQPANSVCNISSTPVTCECVAGFQGDGLTCTDINECQDSSSCPNGNCSNTPGSFVCQCRPGTTNVTGNCTLQCETDYCPDEATCSATTDVGVPVCLCPSGFTGPRCSDSDTTRTLAIVFGVIAGVILIAVVALVIYICKKRNSRSLDMNDKAP